MQIGSSTLSTLPVPARYRSDELDERRQQQREQVSTAQQPSQQAAGEVTRIRTRASAAAQRAEDQSPRFNNLPTYARNAVTAYSNNGPSIEERLGVELAGVDVYA